MINDLFFLNTPYLFDGNWDHLQTRFQLRLYGEYFLKKMTKTNFTINRQLRRHLKQQRNEMIKIW